MIPINLKMIPNQEMIRPIQPLSNNPLSMRASQWAYLSSENDLRPWFKFLQKSRSTNAANWAPLVFLIRFRYTLQHLKTCPLLRNLIIPVQVPQWEQWCRLQGLWGQLSHHHDSTAWESSWVKTTPWKSSSLPCKVVWWLLKFQMSRQIPIGASVSKTPGFRPGRQLWLLKGPTSF